MTTVVGPELTFSTFLKVAKRTDFWCNCAIASVERAST